MPASLPAIEDAGAPSRWARFSKKTSKDGGSTLLSLFDADPVHLPVSSWRERNLQLFEELVARGCVDVDVVSRQAHRFLTETLIREDNRAVVDPLNAGHVRAQNNNVVHYGLSVGVPARTLTIALEAGFIHDLNKAVGEPLRRDRYAVRDGTGQIVEVQLTVAQSVGLNHLGEGTRRALQSATELSSDPLSAPVATAIDECIIHHGLGSSHFIQALVEGENEWWGDEFVDEKTGVRKIIHPPQPHLTLESVIHDLADSTQQMEGGVAWLVKYPEGFWAAMNQSFWAMLSGGPDTGTRGIATSLRQQLIVETATCRGIVSTARAEGLIDRGQSDRLRRAINKAARRTRQWISDSPTDLSKKRGTTVYHDVGRSLGITPEEAVERLKESGPGDEVVEEAIWHSAEALDTRRAKDHVSLLNKR